MTLSRQPEPLKRRPISKVLPTKTSAKQPAYIGHTHRRHWSVACNRAI